MFNFKGALMQFPLSGFSLFIVMGTIGKDYVWIRGSKRYVLMTARQIFMIICNIFLRIFLSGRKSHCCHDYS